MTDNRVPLQKEAGETNLKEPEVEYPREEFLPLEEDETEEMAGEEDAEDTVVRARQTETLQVPIHIDL